MHHAKLSADAMIGKALSMWGDTLWVERGYGSWGGIREIPPEPIRRRYAAS